MNPKVDQYFSEATNWGEELEKLRMIVLDCGLDEELKWRNPCYSYNQNNILILGAFKDYAALSFFKGVLLNDEGELLVEPGEHSQSVRLFKFTSLSQIEKIEDTIKSYIFEAIEVEKAGLKVVKKAVSDYDFPEEFRLKLDEDLALKNAFEGLTPGRQKGYLLYFAAPKQSQTRTSRVEKFIPKILMGKGFHDCTCGFSKRMPTCDGSHKYL